MNQHVSSVLSLWNLEMMMKLLDQYLQGHHKVSTL